MQRIVTLEQCIVPLVLDIKIFQANDISHHCHHLNHDSRSMCFRRFHNVCCTCRDLCKVSYLTCTSSDYRGAVPLALTPDHLNDSLRCWWHISGGWIELAIIVILVIAILQWVQRNLLGMGSLAPDSSLHMRPQNVLLEGTHGRW